MNGVVGVRVEPFKSLSFIRPSKSQFSWGRSREKPTVTLGGRPKAAYHRPIDSRWITARETRTPWLGTEEQMPQLAAMIDVPRPTGLYQVLQTQGWFSLLRILIFFLLKYLTLETCEHKTRLFVSHIAATFISDLPLRPFEIVHIFSSYHQSARWALR